MRNKIDFSADPDALFLNPWQDEGLKLLHKPGYFWRAIPSSIIDGFAVSAHPEINGKIQSFVSSIHKDKRFKSAIEINSVPAVIEQASFRKSHVLARDRLVLSGASATRIFNTYLWGDHPAEEADDTPVDRLNAYFQTCSTTNKGKRIRVEKTFLEPDLDFAIECRNTFNY